MLLTLLMAAQAADPTVRWLPDGRLLVDGRYLMEPTEGSWEVLLYPTRRARPEGGWRALPLRVSPSRQVLLLDDSGLLLGLLDGALAAYAARPVLTASPAPVEAAAWLDDQYILLQQSDPTTGTTACALLDARTRQWSDPVPCPQGDFAVTTAIQHGPADWLAITTAGEGAEHVRLVRYSQVRGTVDAVELPVPESLAQDPAWHVELHFTDAGSLVLSACDLLSASCDAGQTWRLYEWLPGGELRLLREDILPGAVPDPRGSGFAWGEGGRVCLGDPAGERRCYPLPDTLP